ncbi:hypothetical protein ACOMHN_016753 [Nucella lapillus]
MKPAVTAARGTITWHQGREWHKGGWGRVSPHPLRGAAPVAGSAVSRVAGYWGRGSLLPSMMMSELGAGLPSARIHCHKGRIRVGDRHFLSASQALAVYLQQFDRDHQLQWASHSHTTTTAMTGETPSLYNGCVHVHADPPTPLDAACHGGVACVPHSPSGKGITMAHGGVSSPVLNGDSFPHNDLTFSLRLSEADHSGSFPQQYTKQPGSVCSLKDFSAMNGTLHRHTLYGPPRPESVNSHRMSYSSCGDMFEPPQQLRLSTDYTDFSSPPKQSNTLGGSAPPDLNDLVVVDSGFGKGMIDYLDFHVPASGNSKGADLVYTAMPSQRELKELAEDAVRKAKRKRLSKVLQPVPSPSNKSSALCEATFKGAGHQHSRKETSNEKNRQVKEEDVKQQELSYLQQEVDQALSRSAQLLDNLKSTSHTLTTPGLLARDVTATHSADTLPPSTPATPSPSSPHSPPPPSSRASRSGHRYCYGQRPPAPARSASLDGGGHGTQALSPLDALSSSSSSPSGSNRRSRSLADRHKSRSLDNLKKAGLDDPGSCRPGDGLQACGGDPYHRPSSHSPQPASPVRSQPPRVWESQAMLSLPDFDHLPARDSLKSAAVDGRCQPVPRQEGRCQQVCWQEDGCVGEGGRPVYRAVGDRELQYLQRGTSVLADCHDLLQQLQAVNPRTPTPPHPAPHRRNSWSREHSADQTPVSTLIPHSGRQIQTDKAEKDHPHLPSDFSRSVAGGLKRAASVPCVPSTLGTGLDRTLHRTLDDSSMAEFSFMGPGLSFSDLVTTPACSKHTPAANSGTDLPPRHPHRRSRTNGHPGGGKGSEFSPDAGTRNVRSPSASNPVLQDVADILDAIDLNLSEGPETALITAAQAFSVQSADPEAALRDGARHARVRKCLFGPCRERDDMTAAAGEKGSGKGHRASFHADREGHWPLMPAQHAPGTIRSITCPVPSVCALAVQSSLSKGETVQEEKEADEAAELLPALKGYRFELEPGGQSLGKALVHLGRLKSLVQTSPAAHHDSPISTTSTTNTSTMSDPPSSSPQQLSSSLGARPTLQ